MARGRRPFKRRPPTRRYKKMFVIATEGTKTEPQYFKSLEGEQTTVHVTCLKGNAGTAPKDVLARMEDYLKEKGLRPSDEAWLVVDKDRWEEKQLNKLHAWKREAGNRGFALSNPKFEYWLLLHYEAGTRVRTSRSCSERLRKHLPNYDKGVDGRAFTRDMIDAAIERAKKRDTPPCKDWPREAGKTTVYKLVERILADQD